MCRRHLRSAEGCREAKRTGQQATEIVNTYGNSQSEARNRKGLISVNESPSRNSGAGSGARNSGRLSLAPTSARAFATWGLISHARRFGTDRLRESCAIMTAELLTGRLGTATAKQLEIISEYDMRLRSDQLTTLIHEGSRSDDGAVPEPIQRAVLNRAIDARAIRFHARTGLWPAGYRHNG